MSDHISQTLPCPKALLGFVIGRNGHALRAMQNASGARFIINDQNVTHDFNTEYVHVRLCGSVQQVERAKRLVMRRVFDLTQQHVFSARGARVVDDDRGVQQRRSAGN